MPVADEIDFELLLMLGDDPPCTTVGAVVPPVPPLLPLGVALCVPVPA